MPRRRQHATGNNSRRKRAARSNAALPSNIPTQSVIPPVSRNLDRPARSTAPEPSPRALAPRAEQAVNHPLLRIARLLAQPTALALTAVAVGAVATCAASELALQVSAAVVMPSVFAAVSLGVWCGCAIPRYVALRISRTREAPSTVTSHNATHLMEETIAVWLAGIALTALGLVGVAAGAVILLQERFRASLAQVFLIPQPLFEVALSLPMVAAVGILCAVAATAVTILVSWQRNEALQLHRLRAIPLTLAIGFTVGVGMVMVTSSPDLRAAFAPLAAFVGAGLATAVPMPTRITSSVASSTASRVGTRANEVLIVVAAVCAQIALIVKPQEQFSAMNAGWLMIVAALGLLGAVAAIRLVPGLTTSASIPQFLLIAAAIVGLLPTISSLLLAKVAFVVIALVAGLLLVTRSGIAHGCSIPAVAAFVTRPLALGAVIGFVICNVSVWRVARSDETPNAADSSNQIPNQLAAGIVNTATIDAHLSPAVDCGGPRFDLIRITSSPEVNHNPQTNENAERLLRRANSALFDGGRLLIDLPDDDMVHAAIGEFRAGRLRPDGAVFYIRAIFADQRYDALLIGRDIPQFMQRAEQLDVRSTVIALRGTRHLAALLEASDDALAMPELRNWKR